MLKALCRRMMTKSCWVYHANSGGCNGCDIEVLNVLTPYYDAERFGVKLVASPRHADAMLCQGPALRSTAQALRRAYEAMPAPKVVIAIGSCATGGGQWFDSYSVMGPVDKVVPVDFWVPGCPPRPEAILHGVAVALGILGKKVAPRPPQVQPSFPFPRYQPDGTPATDPQPNADPGPDPSRRNGTG
ncbi:MAG TPA: NADH-quinone oxidoreductase subunit B family protein [Anaeromyxobacter sp.]|nr:NADH-quinone oxidoreductase subunit B family protein [Anaeromyxobacter sp.]